jgi:hypothetical protein
MTPKQEEWRGTRLTRVYGSVSWAGFWVGLGIAVANW